MKTVKCVKTLKIIDDNKLVKVESRKNGDNKLKVSK